MLDLKHFQEAKKRVDEVIIPTPLIYSEAFSKECKNQVYIKPENLQRTGAFKIRGAYNKIIKMDEETKSKGKRYKEPKHLDNTSKKSKKKSKGRSK